MSKAAFNRAQPVVIAAAEILGDGESLAGAFSLGDAGEEPRPERTRTSVPRPDHSNSAWWNML